MAQKVQSYTELGEPVGTHSLLQEKWDTVVDRYTVLVLCEFDIYRATQTIYCDWDGYNFSGHCAHCGTIYSLPSN